MSRPAKIAAWIIGLLIALPIVFVAIVLLAANTDPGRRFIERNAESMSGGRIVLSGLAGHFPGDLRLAHAEIRDVGGPWLRIDDVVLQWSPSKLLERRLQVDRLGAARIELVHLPATSDDQPKQTSNLPVRIDIEQLDLERVDIGEAVAGAAASVSVHGQIHAASLEDANIAVKVAHLDGSGSYEVNARMDATRIDARVAADEPGGGLLQRLAKLPDLGPLSLRASIEGPRNDEALSFALTAGPLQASGEGRIDLVGRTLRVDLSAKAPAMTPRPDLRWQSLSMQAHVDGPFARPEAKGDVVIDRLVASGAETRAVRANVQASGGALAVQGAVVGLRLPGPQPELLAGSPVEFRADARLDDAARPVTFRLAHPLLSVEGRANTGADVSATIAAQAPALAPLAALVGMDVKGQGRVDAAVTRRGEATNIQLKGSFDVTGGTSPLARVTAPGTKIDVAANLEGNDIRVDRLQLDSSTLQASAKGSRRGDRLDFDWKIALANLSAIAPALSGPVQAQGRVQGVADDLNISADASGDVATKDFAHGPVTLTLRARGLPSKPVGKIDAHGTLAGAPLQLSASFERRSDGVLRSTIGAADWKSVHAEGTVTLPQGQSMPDGHVVVRIARLADLEAFTGQPVEGNLDASIDLVKLAGHSQAKIQVNGRDAALGGNHVRAFTLAGTVDEPTTQPRLALRLMADGIAASGIEGTARVDATGPQDALKLVLSSDLSNIGGADMHVDSTATLNVPGKVVTVSSLQAQYKGETLKLLAPSQVAFGNGLSVDRLRLGAQQAVLQIAGRILPALDVTASLRDATPALAKAFVPDLQADGKLSMDARLTGSTSQPKGTIRINATGLRVRNGPASALPAANAVVNADLDGDSARVDVNLTAGPQTHLTASGRVPFAATGAIDVRVSAAMDAAIANPMLEVRGRRVKGQLTVDAAVAGSRNAPNVSGSLRLANGDVQDYGLGAHLTNVDALLESSGDTVRISKFTAQAGRGTLSANGTIGLFAPGRPVDLKLTGQNAQPLTSDLVTANMDLDLTLTGRSETRMDLAGSVRVTRADVNIPNALPANVAVLDVRRPDDKASVNTPVAASVIRLDVKVDAPRAIFLHGRGLDAEVGGQLHIGGTTAQPQISGGFEMRRGSFDLAGAVLTFTSGKVSFNGTGVRHTIDPTLDFIAESTSNNITAKLAITGYADAPQISLTSTPELPQDEVLARLLFGVSVKELSALQIAQIGSGLATISGVRGGGFNPLTAVQKTLGLDRLSVGTGAGGSASVEAGRYVSSRVYVGAKQTMSGNTQAQVQVDLTKHLKLQATLGTGGTVQGATPENDPGSSIGLSYQFEY